MRLLSIVLAIFITWLNASPAWSAGDRLVHVVRFCKFLQNFEADLPERQKEEQQVHKITQQALSRLNLPDLDHVLRAYQDYGFMEKFQNHARVS